MIADTSALVCVVYGEDGWNSYYAALTNETVLVSAPTFVETGVVVDSRKSAVLSNRVDSLLAELAIQIVPLTEQQARIARQAYREFGKGSGHPAKLNLGDCFSYALAKDLNQPLLFKGDDFVHTDVRSALT